MNDVKQEVIEIVEQELQNLSENTSADLIKKLEARTAKSSKSF